MPTYNCGDCGRPIFSGDNLRGNIRLPCPRRDCPSRKVKPVRQQKFDFNKRK